MNHLAHLFLSGENVEWIVGNFITDFLTPAEQRVMPPGIRQGIQLHLFIDRTVDNHPLYKQTISMIRSTQGKYAPVVADIFFDYLLYDHWDRYSFKPIGDFITAIYSDIKNNLPPVIPVNVKERLIRMIDLDFLRSYSSVDYMEQTFSMLGKRVHFHHHLEDATRTFLHYETELKQQFDQVFPDIVMACLDYRITLQN